MRCQIRPRVYHSRFFISRREFRKHDQLSGCS